METNIKLFSVVDFKGKKKKNLMKTKDQRLFDKLCRVTDMDRDCIHYLGYE